MADKEEGASVLGDALWFLAVLAVLVVLWFLAGGPGKTDLRGLFLAPPQPLGTGEAYGPQLGTSSAQQEETASPQEDTGGFYLQ